MFDGRIISKSKLRHIVRGEKAILNLSVKLKNGNILPIVVWNELAKSVAQSYNIGDMIEVKGMLLSREYEKVVGDEVVKKMTTEISAISIC